MSNVIAVDFRARQRRAVQQAPHPRSCDLCQDVATIGPLCYWHTLIVEAEGAELRERHAAEKRAGVRCCHSECGRPIPRRQQRVVLPGGLAMHMACGVERQGSNAS